MQTRKEVLVAGLLTIAVFVLLLVASVFGVGYCFRLW